MSPDGRATAGLAHATALTVNGVGFLVRGPARSGKSALAFATLRRAEALGVPAALVCDDRVRLYRTPDGRTLRLEAPAALAGLIEVSGVGILREAFQGHARLDCLVDLVADPDAERLPEAGTVLEGVFVRRVVLLRREAAFGAEILLHLARQGLPPSETPAAGA